MAVRRGGCAFGTKAKNLAAIPRVAAVVIIDHPLSSSSSSSSIAAAAAVAAAAAAAMSMATAKRGRESGAARPTLLGDERGGDRPWSW